VPLAPEDRLVLDAGLELAGEVLPGSSSIERLEAMAQELLGSVSGDPDADEVLDPAFRARRTGDPLRREELEAETERWAILEPVPDWPAPVARFYDTATAAEIDRLLRELARLRSGWDAILGYCAHAVKRSRLYALLGFTSFRHYVDERLGLSPRAGEQRAALEERLWRSAALREGRRQGLSFEKLRLLARLSETEIASWVVRAKALTCIELRRRIEGEVERQMRARARLGLSLPRRIALLLTAAIQAVRSAVGGVVTPGRCLAFLAKHFHDVWRPLVPRRRTRSKKVRERDEGHCQVPGCSRHGAHAHHIEFRSHGGGDEPPNQISLCAYHHLRCIHGGWLRVVGRAPDQLTWFLGGAIWRGPVPC
jgi:hypothetical protein